MNAFLFGSALQWKLDIRSKTLLITCYLVPLLFFAVMGGIFTAVMPGADQTLIPSMTVMGVSMGAYVGVPPSLVEIYGSDIRKVYKANGVPMFLGVVSIYISSLIHMLLMSTIIYIAAPLAFHAVRPANQPLYFVSLIIFIAVSLSIGCLLGLTVKNQSKLTMLSQIVFIPSTMLSGIMVSTDLLPGILRGVGKIFPATWGFKLMVDNGFCFDNLWPLLVTSLAAVMACGFFLRRLK